MYKSITKGVSLQRLYAFLEVCKTLHIGRAAERLEIAQPSLSAQIRALEEVLDARLFNRRNRAIDLTDAGRQLRDEAEVLLNAHQNAVQRVIHIARGEMGRLSLGFVGSALAEGQIARHLNQLHEHFPASQIELNEMNCQAAMTALIHNEIDLVVLRGPGELPDFMKHRVLSRTQLVVVMPPGHALEVQRDVSIKDLADYPMIGYASVDDHYGITPVVTGMAQATGTPLNIQWRITTVAGVLNLVASGAGIGIVPARAAARASSSVVTRRLQEPADSELWLVWHERRSSALLHRFLNVVGTHMDA